MIEVIHTIGNGRAVIETDDDGRTLSVELETVELALVADEDNHGSIYQ